MNKANEMPKAYEPKSFEQKWYSFWLENDLFKATVNPDKEKFSIVMPPPNVTGALHMGHALDTVLQDIYTRYNRMLGNETLWLPGTDHASIATHAKIEDMLAREGTSRWELGRDKFLERAWDWKEKYGHMITDQLKVLGASCDWSKERFTMDEDYSNAVNEAFVRLYEKGLIYKGKYMVNFCPGCQTVISDIEVEHEDTQGHLYYVRYPVVDPADACCKSSEASVNSHALKPAQEYAEFIEVATTRPETMLGDTAVAVHPDDPRYSALIGKYALLPLVGRLLPIIADDHVDPKFGTGAVKVTPSHDPNDFEMGLRHNLTFVSVIGTDGKMTEDAGIYKGLDRFECRKRILEDLESQGYLIRTENITHAVGHCQRCHSPVEPLISEQWFVKMKPLAEPALKVVQDGQVQFVPDRFSKIYEHWMTNIKDWCISRQLWWGHRIPVWYCEDCSEMIVAKTEPESCPKCGGKVHQDEDVLDTWFSSALWPFSTLGWPENTPDLEYFFPTDILITGYDIIFFWVARMIFSSMEFMGEPPFHHVLIHGLVRDALGRKMSKSLDNGIDPLDVVSKYGTDALRISLVSGVAMGSDMRFYDEKVEGARNFCNKVWNAARYCLTNLCDWEPPQKWLEASPGASASLDGRVIGLTSRWILTRLEETIFGVKDALERYEPGEALDLIINFVWSEFCDWYIEFSKEELANPEAQDETKFVLYYVLKESLALLHPFAPFITEELWSYLPKGKNGSHGSVESIMIAKYPSCGKFTRDDLAQEAIGTLVEAIRGIRNMRAEVDIPTGKKEKVVIFADDASLWEALSPYVKRLAWAEPLEIVSKESGAKRLEKALTTVVKGAEVFLPLAGVIDIEEEITRLEKVARELEKDLDRTETRLSDKEFLSKAPQGIIEKQKKRQEEASEKLEIIRKRIAMLEEIR